VFLDVGLRKSIYDWRDKTKNLNADTNLARPTKASFFNRCSRKLR
jgi:hypothetical protein